MALIAWSPTLDIAQVRHLCQLQDDLNRQVSPDWKTAHYPWSMAMLAELKDLADHVGWKWWEDQASHKSFAQVAEDSHAFMAVVRVFHLWLSSRLALAQIQSDHEKPDLLYEDVSGRLHAWHRDPPPQPLDGLFTYPHELIREVISQLLAGTWQLLPTYRLLQLCDKTWQDLYRMCVANSVLDAFRRRNGLKEGTYQAKFAIGSGDEAKDDAQHLQEIIGSTCDGKSDSIIHPDPLMRELQLRYDSRRGHA